MARLAIIPARGGSKRIPRKNIKHFLGKPIISYSIELAKESGLFDEIMVSTDDDEISRISKEFGASVPFKRSKENSNDLATTSEVLVEVIESYQTKGKKFDYCCCIYPTAPLILLSSLQESFQKLIDTNSVTCFPIVEYEYSIFRSLRFKNNRIELRWPENLKARSQDLESAYHDAGQFYWFETKRFMEVRELFNANTTAIVLPRTAVQDIDNEVDWSLAEMKYNFINRNGHV